MTEDQFHAQRSALHNKFAAAGADLLDFMHGSAGALAAIPNTHPQQYAVAGDLSAIQALLPNRRERRGERPADPLYFGPETGQPRRFAALITSSGHGLLQEYGTTFEHARPGQEVIDVVEMRAALAIANKAAEEGGLPVINRESIRDAVADSMTGLYHCGRVWSAWGVGTMSEDDFSPAGEDEEILDNITDAVISAIATDRAARPVANKAEVDLQDIEQYRVQMAAISTASLGYWKEGEAILPEYDTVPLRDVAKLYAKYEALHTAAQAGQVAVPMEPTEEMLNAARDWSVKKYSQGIGNDAAIGCWKAMLTAAPSPASESLRSPQEAAGTEKGAAS